jgi:hypothetical protein
MSPKSQARAEAKAQVMLAEMPLNELRRARGPNTLPTRGSGASAVDPGWRTGADAGLAFGSPHIG